MIFILTGPVGSGKTSFLRGLIEELREAGVAFDGFLSLRVMKGGEPEGYDLLDIQEGTSWPFLRRTDAEKGQRVGPYIMLPSGLDQANAIIKRSRPGDLLIVDEIGPLELEGRGLWPTLKGGLFDERRRSLAVIRESLLGKVRDLLAQLPLRVFEPEKWPDLAKVLMKQDEIPIKIKFFAYFRELFGAKEKELKMPGGSTVRGVLDTLSDTPARRAEIFAGAELKPHIVVMINGAALPYSTGLETPLNGGDVVAIFPLMGGG